MTINRIIKKIDKPFLKIFYKILFWFFHKRRVLLYWFNLHQNFGDSINPSLIEQLSGMKVLYVPPRKSEIKHIFAIGSIIEHCNQESVIWGSGFISAESELKYFPKKVCAVRGPKSRKRMLDYGIECPPVYGDPALLLPCIYQPKVEKKFKLGIIPHHNDFQNTWLQENLEAQDVLVIDMQEENIWKIIDDICSCEKIASSSLHGIITADAYGIPSVWIEFSDKVIGKGFKFLDYFESVGRKDSSAFRVKVTSTISDIEDLFYDYQISIDLHALLRAAPFPVKQEFLECETKSFYLQGSIKTDFIHQESH